ncbi:MAG: deoxyribodipyrimidine photo-lyase [Pseudomonadota bacterium]
MPTTAIVWLRRDLRVGDQPALHHAAAHHDHVVPVFIHAPDEEADWQPGAASQWWLHHSLVSVAASFAKLGSPLVVRQGASLATLRALAKETGAEAVYWNRLYEPAVIARDARIKEALRADGLCAESFNGAVLFEPWQLKTGAGEPYRVYSPMFRSAEARFDEIRKPLPAPKKLLSPAAALKSDPIEALSLLPTIAWDAGFHEHWQPGEKSALKRLEQFASQPIAKYKDLRDQPALDGAVSGLSPHLHFGEISPHQCFVRAQQAHGELTGAGAHGNIHHFIKELFWREFSHHLIYHYPKTPTEPMYERFAAFPWRKPADYSSDLQAWQQGRTGIPIVDAGMRQLWHTGWMHNRVRMIVASLLTKNLLIPWQEGASWFWDTLVDASLPQNTLGWQWAAGCGADAAPYFRIFNPVLQGEKFDADGSYVRTWVPELSTMPAKFIHKPWEAPGEVRRAAGIGLDSVYAKPIIELMASRDRALAAFARLKADNAA